MRNLFIIIILLISYLAIFEIFDIIDQPETFYIWLVSGVILIISTALFCFIKYNIISSVGIFAVGFLMQVVFLLCMPNYNFSISESSSNFPSIKPNDLVVARAFNGNYNRGQMISFLDKNGYLSRKRIHGIPGDKILVCNDKVYVNNFYYSLNNDWQPVEFDNSKRCSSRRSKYSLSEDEFFVLGDNLNESLDSRHHGPIKITQIKFLELYSVPEDSPWFGKAKVTLLQINFQTP